MAFSEPARGPPVEPGALVWKTLWRTRSPCTILALKPPGDHLQSRTLVLEQTFSRHPSRRTLRRLWERGPLDGVHENSR